MRCKHGMTSATISITVTARFDGCWCDYHCHHIVNYEYGVMCTCTKENRCYIGAVRKDTAEVNLTIPTEQRYAYVRTRWCCEAFGMGDDGQVAQPTCQGCGAELQPADKYNDRTVYHRLCPHCLELEWNWMIDITGQLNSPIDQKPKKPDDTEHKIWTNIDGSTVDLTQSAIDNEAKDGRCTYDE